VIVLLSMCAFFPPSSHQQANIDPLLQYEQAVDLNADFEDLPDIPARATFYGQLEEIFVFTLAANDTINLDSPITFALAAIAPCKLLGTSPESYRNLGTTEIVDLRCVQSVIGRVKVGNVWHIIDRNGDLAHVDFVDLAEEPGGNQ
jgi:hypothetical protein